MQQSSVAGIHEAIGVLLKRQVHIQPDAVLAPGAAVGGLHDSPAGAGHHLKATLHGLHRELLGELVGGFIGIGSGGAEHRHLAGLAVRGEHVEAVADIGQGPVDQPPLVGIAAALGNLQQAHDAAFNRAPLRVVLQFLIEGLKRALLHQPKG